ncbi:MAG: hypothetical protein K0U61_08005 [Alphaproteobacteria bacterium]|nr:hypothetical protein [Alphaproteobacteria bacterium]
MKLQATASAFALSLVVAACSQGGSVASPGTTTPTTPPTGGGGGGTGGGSATASCPTGFSEGTAIGSITTCLLSGTLLGTTTLTNVDDVVYRLNGRVDVGVDTGADGTDPAGSVASLVIEPGVTIVGATGQDYLVVTRGSTLEAAGTAAQPITFTSALDIERQNDSDTSNDLGENFDGEWGGIVMLGSAPQNRCLSGSAYFTDSCQQRIEGVTSPDALYGGDDADDYSGTLRYVVVKHAGFELTPDNELNGIAFGGVGDSTVVEYIQIYNNADDGVEFFGGTVNAKYLVLNGNNDESIDTDNGYQGTIQHVVVEQTAGRGDNITEQSSVVTAPASQSSNPLIANFTFVGTEGDQVLRSNTGSIGRLLNGVIVYEDACFAWDSDAGDGDDTGFGGVGVDPSFSSVLADCGTNGAGLTDSTPETQAAVDAAAAAPNSTFNTSAPVVNTLASRFFSGTAEQGVTETNLPAIDASFDNTDYIGAFAPNESETNNWATGWTFGLFSDTLTCPSGTIDNGATINGQKVCVVSGVLNSDVRLTRGNLYELDGRVDVGVDMGADGTAASGVSATLTIESGVTLFANTGQDYLVVNRGSDIRALGSASNPIVFTSEADIRGTQPNADQADGEWGGIVILGSAPQNRCLSGSAYFTDSCQQRIEGVTSPDALYGGDDVSDSSGVLRYVQVKYAGFELTPDNELNGIAFGGVGDGTVVEYIQVHNNADDGVEFFGGTVNAKYLVLTGNNDESIDTDNGYQGAIQYVIVNQVNGRGDNITEQSSVVTAPASQSSNPLIANFTFIGTDGDQVFRSNTGSIGRLLNGVIVYDDACFAWDSDAGDGDDTGFGGVGVDPSFSSVQADCGTNGAGLTDSTPETQAAVDAAAAAPNSTFNTSLPVVNTLISTFVNGSTESAAVATDLTAIDPFFDNTDYIGAVENASDTWWQGWTCGLPNGDAC